MLRRLPSSRDTMNGSTRYNFFQESMAAIDMETSSATQKLQPVPLTLEGAAILHQMMRLKWTPWRKLSSGEQEELLREAADLFAPWEKDNSSAVYSLLGHKGDLLFIHFRNSFDQLNATELRLNQLRIFEFLEPVGSYLSVVELGLYDSSVKLYRELAAKDFAPHSAEWKHAVEELLVRQGEAMRPRLFPKIPVS